MGEHKLPKLEKSNVLFVRDLMEVSPYGALGEAFIIEAIRYYSGAIAATPPAPDDPEKFINPKTWQEVAIDVKRRMDERYESRRNQKEVEEAKG